MLNPISTYRIQFNKQFTFNDFEIIIPYLQKLGVSTIYASPIFEASPGSIHGYDGVNPHRINPEIGTEEQLRGISKKLKAHNISLLQDIVPNHMAFHSNNEWLMDVLEKGPRSLYASFFDVVPSSKVFNEKLMVPFLKASLAEIIKNGELKVVYYDQRLVFKYYDSTYPLNPKSYITILRKAHNEPEEVIQQLVKQIQKLEDEPSYFLKWNEIRLELATLIKNEAVKGFLERCIEIVNSKYELLQEI